MQKKSKTLEQLVPTSAPVKLTLKKKRLLQLKTSKCFDENERVNMRVYILLSKLYLLVSFVLFLKLSLL